MATTPTLLSPLTGLNAKAESIPRSALTEATQSPASGTVQSAAVVLQGGQVISEIGVVTVAAAATPTHQWVGIASLAGVILGISADNTGAYGGTNTLVVTALAAAVTIPGEGGVFYLFSMGAATTPATLAGVTGLAAISALLPMEGHTSLTAQTTPPAVGTSLGAFTGSASIIYAVCF